MGAKFVINGDLVTYALIWNSPPERLTEVVSRIRTIAETWAKEKLTDERRSQIVNLATGDPGIQEFLAGKDYEIGGGDTLDRQRRLERSPLYGVDRYSETNPLGCPADSGSQRNPEKSR